MRFQRSRACSSRLLISMVMMAALAGSRAARADEAKGSAGVGVSLGGGTAGAAVTGEGAASGAPAGAQASGNAAAKPAAAPGAATVTTYSPELQKGNAAYVARDFAGAVAAYQQAITSAPNDPMGHYLLGEAELAAGNLSEAEASWNNGIRFVKDKDSLHAKLLFVLADLRERQGKWADAKQAWTDYAQFVASHPEAHGYAATATERQARIAAHEDLETKYAAVRQRIEDRKKELEKPAPDDGPQKGSKAAPAKKK